MEQVEELLGVSAGLTVHIDEADQDALALGILCKTVLESCECGSGILCLEIDVGEVGEDVAVSIVTEVDALLVVLDSLVIVACHTGNQTCVVGIDCVDLLHEGIVIAGEGLLEEL